MDLSRRNIIWFTKKYPNEDDRYLAISNYLHKSLELEPYDHIGKSELLEFIRNYTIKKTGLDPYNEAMKY